ncbi:glutamate 5-kinase [Maricaulis sp. W15]|uniref:Glutamate 5-kinase n=1 Tax=Maricaulis maris TaxID=74318 RepID=A0A495D3C6_9PROT|nr:MULTISPECIES: glutamate 5-kinase [Maricaulis]OLF71101.1 glutamate 5-kinase [Maricaulis sp. W15]RKQ96244.1 glutamate 5-kinase [Maricaulis maris]
MSQRKRIVVKIGSSLLANDSRLTLRYAFMNELLADIARLRDEGHDVVLASSGAVALGLNAIKTSPEDAGVLDKQAAAACGQPLLLNAYKQVAHEHGFDIAQILVTLEDLEERRRFLNTKNTIQRLFERDVMPIVNENDTVTTEEIRVGDNDRLAAKVAQMIQADHLIILTSIDGLYDRDPSDPDAQFVETIDDVTEYLEVTSGTSSLGSGGMLTKIQAANLAQNAGCTTLIAEGTIDRPVSAVLSGERRHTKCVAKGTPASSWAVWLTNRLQRAGSLVLNDAAAEALATSPSGVSHEDIVKIHGAFTKGDVLHIYSESGEEVARGLTNFSSDETMMLARHTDQDVKELLGYHARPEIVNRDNMVILNAQHLPWDAPTKSLRLVAS